MERAGSTVYSRGRTLELEHVTGLPIGVLRGNTASAFCGHLVMVNLFTEDPPHRCSTRRWVTALDPCARPVPPRYPRASTVSRSPLRVPAAPSASALPPPAAGCHCHHRLPRQRRPAHYPPFPDHRPTAPRRTPPLAATTSLRRAHDARDPRNIQVVNLAIPHPTCTSLVLCSPTKFSTLSFALPAPDRSFLDSSQHL